MTKNPNSNFDNSIYGIFNVLLISLWGYMRIKSIDKYTDDMGISIHNLILQRKIKIKILITYMLYRT